jgi:mRNA interferase HigB
MKRIVAKRTLKEFWEKHSDCEQHLKTWFDIAKHADWKTPNDIKATFASASIIADNRVVFNIKGNSYRLIVKFNYPKQWAFIRFIGTHAEYDKIDAATI